MTRYAIRDGLAWLEALDGGRQERVVWLADVDTGEHFILEGTGWLVWILLDEGAASATELQDAAATDGADDAFAEVDLPEFLDGLVARGVLVRVDSV